MAESSAGVDGADTRWPGGSVGTSFFSRSSILQIILAFASVSVSDGDKCCTVFLKITNLKVKKKHGIFGALEPTNGDIKITLDTDEIYARITVRDQNEKLTVFEYKKKLPEEIDLKKSKWELFKAERIKLELLKAKSGSWERHAKYLQTPE